jgi:hypothetical protein
MREIFQYDERVMIRESRKNPTEITAAMSPQKVFWMKMKTENFKNNVPNYSIDRHNFRTTYQLLPQLLVLLNSRHFLLR